MEIFNSSFTHLMKKSLQLLNYFQLEFYYKIDQISDSITGFFSATDRRPKKVCTTVNCE